MLVCLGTFIMAALVGVLVLARSMPLTDVIQGRQRLVAFSSALLTALFVAGMAGLVTYLVLARLIQ
jgi:hypothetical protein